MLHIILLILKIIGIVLLVILGLLLAILLLVLLVPIRYRLDGSYYGKLKGTARITWLLHILSIRASYEEELTVSVRVLGWNLLRQGFEPDVEEDVEQDTLAPKELRPARQDMKRSQEYSGGKPERCSTEDSKDYDGGRPERYSTGNPKDYDGGKPERVHTGKPAGHRAANTKNPDDGKPRSLDMEELICLDLEELKDLGIEGETDREAGEQGDFNPKEHEDLGDRLQIQEIRRIRGIRLLKSRILRRLSLVLEKFKFLFKRVCDTLKHIKETYKAVLEFLKASENQETLKLILRQLKALLRHIRPRKASGTIVFGFEEPYTTGQVLSAASIFYAWYGQKIELIPMFDRSILEGELRLEGRIRLVTVLYRGLLVYLDKNFRVLLNRWQQRQE